MHTHGATLLQQQSKQKWYDWDITTNKWPKCLVPLEKVLLHSTSLLVFLMDKGLR